MRRPSYRKRQNQDFAQGGGLFIGDHGGCFVGRSDTTNQTVLGPIEGSFMEKLCQRGIPVTPFNQGRGPDPPKGKKGRTWFERPQVKKRAGMAPKDNTQQKKKNPQPPGV